MNNTLLQLYLLLSNLSSNTYLVGGCVRDMLLGIEPKDFDIVCDIDLDLVSQTLQKNGWKVDEAGKQFLVMIVSKNNEQFEIANFRNDGNYSDGRRPDSVSIATINEDCIRRDFTVNSLYFNPFTNQVLDPTGKGLQDLQNSQEVANAKASCSASV